MSESFPNLYNLARTEGAKVIEVWENSRGNGAWNPRFIRPFNDWEMEAFQNFISITNNKKITPLKRVRLFWKGDKIGYLNVKAYFMFLEGPPPLAHIKVLWSPYVPSTHKSGFFFFFFYAWEA